MNSAPHCSGHAGGMTDPMLEGGAKRRKGEGRAERAVAQRRFAVRTAIAAIPTAVAPPASHSHPISIAGPTGR